MDAIPKLLDFGLAAAVFGLVLFYLFCWFIPKQQDFYRDTMRELLDTLEKCGRGGSERGGRRKGLGTPKRHDVELPWEQGGEHEQDQGPGECDE